MKLINDSFELNNPDSLYKILSFVNEDLNDIFFFDIETTGFSRSNCICYLIGGIYFKDGKAYYIQWFADSIKEEAAIISAFYSFISDKNILIHFNGDAFDIPFLSERANILGINFNLSNHKSLDLYKLAKKCKNLLKLSDYKQKTIELFLGIYREDKYSGGELIDIYHSYVKSHNPANEALLLLHNHDDIIGMTDLASIISYYSILQSGYSHCRTDLSDKDLSISLLLKVNIPKAFEYSDEIISIIAKNDSLTISFNIFRGELKYYYDNYKDYYYMPLEDIAIHKSVAEYVDKSCREKATKNNCYTRFTSSFIKVSKKYNINNCRKYYMQSINDDFCYIEINEHFFNDENFILTIIKNVIDSI